MEHVVFFPAHDGTPAFRRVAGLEDAVRLVEHLRNVEGIAEVSVHSLAEVPLAFKAWYRVELPADAPVAVEAAPEPDVAAPAAEEVGVPAVVEDIPEQPVVALAASNGQAVGGGSKSLGFFAS
ncbi:MAG: hypothetical protein JWO12_3046 [Frankiales bacterium]|nr:hypothetical protein [Frankiales bacterium]